MIQSEVKSELDLKLEKTSQEFEQTLQRLGFTLDVDEDECKCEHGQVDLIMYVQTDCDGPEELALLPANKSRYLHWYKHAKCQSCMEGYMSCLDCGGHYNNIRLYRCNPVNGDESIETGYDWKQEPLDPEKPVWDDEND